MPPLSVGGMVLRYPRRSPVKPSICSDGQSDETQTDLASTPSRTAQAATSARPPRPSFIKMSATWTAAVLGQIYRRSASRPLIGPSAMMRQPQPSRCQVAVDAADAQQGLRAIPTPSPRASIRSHLRTNADRACRGMIAAQGLRRGDRPQRGSPNPSTSAGRPGRASLTRGTSSAKPTSR